MEIKVNDLHYSIRMFMLFEQITMRPYQGGLNDNITLFYSALVSTAFINEKKGIQSPKPDPEELMDIIDQNPHLLQEFVQWLEQKIKEQNHLFAKAEEGDDKKKE